MAAYSRVGQFDHGFYEGIEDEDKERAMQPAMGFIPGWIYPGKSETVLPKAVEHWSLTTLREKLVKIGAKVVRHGRYVTFQLARWRCRESCHLIWCLKI